MPEVTITEALERKAKKKDKTPAPKQISKAAVTANNPLHNAKP